MIEIDEKHRRTKAVILSNFKRPLPPLKASTQGATRQPAPKVDTAASECDGGKGAPEAVPQNVTGADNEPPDSTGAISPGKFDPRDGDASLVANYVSEISGNWQRGVDAFMNIARLCAQASEQLTVAQRSELMPELPFGEATFSKFVQIGTDTRLNAPEVQRLLPPHYTTTYAVTLLTDEELKEAIAEKVIHPDMQREELQRWRKSHRERVRVAPSPQATTNDSAVASLPIAPTRDGVGSGLFRSALSQHEIQDSLDAQDGLVAGPEGAEEESQHSKDEVCNDQIVPVVTADKLAPRTDDDERFERLKTRWEVYLAPDWQDAAEATRARFRVEVLGYSALHRIGRRPKHTSNPIQQQRSHHE